jgi:outer membrane protein OmpA-like peptidoglycan-associated protein
MTRGALAAVSLILALILGSAARSEIALTLPEGAERTAARFEPLASYNLPLGIWRSTSFPARLIEGRFTQTAWRIKGNTDSTLRLLRPLRAQIEAAGYSVVFECETDVCGGFDFRFAMEILPEPEMHVDLGDFRYLAARRGQGATAEFLALLVSRSPSSGFVHLTQIYPLAADLDSVISPGEQAPETWPEPAPSETKPSPGFVGFASELESSGRVVLDDLAFEIGSATLNAGRFASLSALAAYLATNPARKVVLVGHTDALGALEPNVALSRRRAEAARERLISDYGVNPSQLGAEGAGWLAPRASNLTAEGRAKNRRVEVVLTST